MTFTQKIYFILALVLLSFTHSMEAQKSNVSGYLGKRAMIEYNSYLSPNMFSSIIEGSPFVHNLNFHYILKRRFQMGINYENYKLSSDGGSNFKFNDSSLKGNAIGLNFDWYRKGLLAPVGMYFRLGAKFLFGEFTEYKEIDSTTGALDLVTDSYIHFAYTLEYGIRRVFLDRVIFNVGGSVGDVVGIGIDPRGYKSTLGGLYMIRFHVGLGVLLF
ncbi:MAG: hypothetical protein AB8F94_21960 [Saprospiraceae bacterium]